MDVGDNCIAVIVNRAPHAQIINVSACPTATARSVAATVAVVCAALAQMGWFASTAPVRHRCAPANVGSRNSIVEMIANVFVTKSALITTIAVPTFV